ncbi:MAG: NUDIX hydrolase, partial [Clostridium sp.]
IDRLAFIHENFFNGSGSLKGYNCHEIAFYYLMKPRGTKKLNSNSYSGGYREYMHWLPIEKLSNYKTFPTFFNEKLSNIKGYVEHIITDER